MKVSVIGAGAVGGQLAFILALKKYRDIALVDIDGDLARGRAMDIMQSEPLWGFPGRVEGSSDYSVIEGSSVVVITAGSPRKPGMSREELFKINFLVIETVCENIRNYAPDSIIMVITNPLDIMTYAAWKISGFESRRVMGMGGLLDSCRYRYFISLFSGTAPDESEGTVLGPHGAAMVPLSGAKTAGKNLLDVAGEKESEKIKKETAAAGGQIVSLLKSGSAFFAPASSAARMVDAISEDRGEILPASVFSSGVWDLPPVYMGLPAKLGRRGVRDVVKTDISSRDLELLRQAGEKIYNRVKELGLEEDL